MKRRRDKFHKAEGYAEFMAEVERVAAARSGNSKAFILFIRELMPAVVETANNLQAGGHEQSSILVALADAMGFVLSTSIASVVPRGVLTPLVSELFEATKNIAVAEAQRYDRGGLQ